MTRRQQEREHPERDTGIMPDVFDGRYVAIVVSVPGRSGDKDFLGEVYKDAEGPWKVAYRFRYYRDDNAFHSKDEKRPYWWACPPSVDEEGAVQTLLRLCAQLGDDGYDTSRLDAVDIRSDRMEVFMDKLKDRPWFNTQRTNP